MKTIRQFVLSPGALLGAACFASGQSLIPALDEHVPERGGDDPKGYVLVSTLNLKDTMDGRKELIEWACYADYDIEADKPALRRTTWLVGTLKRAPGLQKGIPLWDIGAQHRGNTIMLRLVSKKTGATVKLEKFLITVDANGNEVETAEADPTVDGKGFYTIDPRPGPKGKVQYRIKSDDAALRLEAYYKKHPPGDKTKQEEDGGPPSIPPVNEN